VTLDQEIVIGIDKHCNCSLRLSIRNLIDTAVSPTMLNLTSIISASLVNLDYFGNYKIDHLFILGSLFDCAQESLANAAFTKATLQAAEDNIERKEIDVKCFVSLNFRHKMIQPKLNSKPFFLESLTKGILHQVAKETYVVYITFQNIPTYGEVTEGLPLKILYQTNDLKNIKISKAGHAMVVVRKGQIIPFEGIKKTVYIVLEYIPTAEYLDALFNLEMCKLHHDNDDYRGDHQQEGTTTLEDKIRENVFQFAFCLEEGPLIIDRFGLLLVPLTVEFKPNNYSSVLQFHLTPGCNTGFDDYVEMGSFELGVPLTIAYF
jgi:hypothetical protein